MNYFSKLNQKHFWGLLLTVLFVIAFLNLVNPTDMMQIVIKMGWQNLIQVFALVAITQLFRSLRFFILLSSWTNIGYYLIFKITCIYQFLNHILPMRSGELSFPFLLKRYSNCGYSSSIAQLILIRIYDVLSLGLIMSLSLINLYNRGIIKNLGFLRLEIVLLLLLLGLGVVILLRFIFKQKNYQQLNKASANQIWNFLEPKISRIKSIFVRMKNELSRYNNITLHLKILLSSLIIWLVLFTIFWKVLLLADIQISFPEVVIGSSFANLTQLLPLNTIGNIGTLEAGWVVGFVMLGFNSRQVLAVGFLMHTVVILAAGVYAFISWVALLQRKSSSIN